MGGSTEEESGWSQQQLWPLSYSIFVILTIVVGSNSQTFMSLRTVIAKICWPSNVSAPPNPLPPPPLEYKVLKQCNKWREMTLVKGKTQVTTYVPARTYVGLYTHVWHTHTCTHTHTVSLENGNYFQVYIVEHLIFLSSYQLSCLPALTSPPCFIPKF